MNEKELTPAEKGKITRERNAAARAKGKSEKAEQERKDKELITTAMRSIIADERATPRERLDALKILDHLTYSHYIPYSVTHSDTRMTDAEIKAEFDKLKASKMTTK